MFKLKEKINGKVSKQISEIERRKLSPYRFSNSPLKQKKFKENNCCGSSKQSKRSEIPISKLSEIPEEQYIVKASQNQQPQPLASPFRKLDQNVSTNSPQSLVRAAASKFFYKKFGKSRNVKRLNATVQVTASPGNSENCPNRSLQVNSPAGKHLNTKWKLSNDTIDL